MNIVFYVYGNHKMGMGHIYRSAALIAAFKKKLSDISTSCLSMDYEDGINKLQKFGYPVFRVPLDLSEQQEIEYCSGILTELRPDVLITDALQVSPAKMALFRESSRYLVSIDDTGDGRLLASLAINVFFQVPTRADGPLELQDIKYLILREECSASERPTMTIKPIVERILVTQGGSDTRGVTVKIARALAEVDKSIEIALLLGSAFKHEKELQTVIQSSGRHFTIMRDVQDVISLFSQCDLAITLAGNTLFELAAIGVPCIVLAQEYHELDTANRIEDYGFIKQLGMSKDLSEEDIYRSVNELVENYPLRLEMSEKSKKIIDGLGAERVVNVILKEIAGDRL